MLAEISPEAAQKEYLIKYAEASDILEIKKGTTQLFMPLRVEKQSLQLKMQDQS